MIAAGTHGLSGLPELLRMRGSTSSFGAYLCVETPACLSSHTGATNQSLPEGCQKHGCTRAHSTSGNRVPQLGEGISHTELPRQYQSYKPCGMIFVICIDNSCDDLFTSS